MPELPELEVLREQLIELLPGKRIASFKVIKPYILKNYFAESLSGETVETVERKGKYLVIGLTGHSIALHLMRRGKITYVKGTAPSKSVAAWMLFSDNSSLCIGEQGHKKRVSMYITSRGRMIPAINTLGTDPQSQGFSVEWLQSQLQKGNCQLKKFLRTQTVIAGIGNVYADEILWKARLSPFKKSLDLNDDEILRLHDAVKKTLSWAIQEVRKNGIKEKRGFLNIHGKKGEECPRCKSKIRNVSFTDSETYYCPVCQTSGKVFKDRRMSKFYR